MNDLCKKYKTFLKINRSASDNTIKSYIGDVKNFCSFVGIDINNVNDLQAIAHNDVKRWLMHEQRITTNRTISRKIVAIKMYFLFLNEIENIKNDTILNLNGLKFVSSLPKAVDLQTIMNIVQDLDKLHKYKQLWETYRDRLLIIVLFSTGMRISEALSLTHNDIVKETFFIFGKGNKERLIPQLDVVKQYYKYYQQNLLNAGITFLPADWLFINAKGKKLSVRFVDKLFQEIKISKNLQYFSPHVMRHSFATSLLENGANIKQIQDLLGHEKLATTQKYTKITKKIIGDKLKKINW